VFGRLECGLELRSGDTVLTPVYKTGRHNKRRCVRRFTKPAKKHKHRRSRRAAAAILGHQDTKAPRKRGVLVAAEVGRAGLPVPCTVDRPCPPPLLWPRHMPWTVYQKSMPRGMATPGADAGCCACHRKPKTSLTPTVILLGTAINCRAWRENWNWRAARRRGRAAAALWRRFQRRSALRRCAPQMLADAHGSACRRGTACRVQPQQVLPRNTRNTRTVLLVDCRRVAVPATVPPPQISPRSREGHECRQRRHEGRRCRLWARRCAACAAAANFNKE
jgi:hypothetical protein